MERQDTALNSEQTTRDPVCGMIVDDSSEHVHRHDGREVRFCSDNMNGADNAGYESE